MTTDPIADILIQIKNGYMARRKTIKVPHSRMKEQVVKILSQEKFVGTVEVKKDPKSTVKSTIHIELIYTNKSPNMTDVVKVSKPGRRVYVDKLHIPRVLGGMGKAILSTPTGIMTDKDARKKGIGGELICKVW
jgi:small subunit ribosomal protein S8